MTDSYGRSFDFLWGDLQPRPDDLANLSPSRATRQLCFPVPSVPPARAAGYLDLQRWKIVCAPLTRSR